MKPFPLALALSALTTPALAASAPCWYENGVVVVTASVAGVVGDFILDTAQPMTQLAMTQAQTAGYEGSMLVGDVRLAGVSVREQAIAVADLDVRTGLLPTPIAGVIGADVLAGKVLDLSFSPCRLGFWRPDRAPPFGRARTIPLERLPQGLHAVRASVSDGAATLPVRLAPATGSDAPVRLSDEVASAPGRDRPLELYPYGVFRPKLQALGFAGRRWPELPAGLLRAAEAPADGWLGAPVLARFRVRFDFARRRLLLKAQ